MIVKGPFRADQVGSLLRPPALIGMRERHERGEATDAELKAAEDEAIIEVIRRQESVGMKAVTDGEYRRENWSLDFFAALEGTEVVEMALAPQAHGTAQIISKTLKVAKIEGELGAFGHPMVDHIRYVLANTSQTAKLTIPSPTMIVSASRDWRQAVNTGHYPDLEAVFAGLAKAYIEFLTAAYAAGCRYLQLDDVNMAYLCDAKMRAAITARGDDPDVMLGQWIKLLNTVLAARPADLTMTTHICRGNFKSSWFAQGGYEPIAERIFGELDYDGFFLEYDSDRAGGFEPLRYLPKGKKRVVLGLMTTKTGELEDRDLIRSRVEQASAFVDSDQLCLSPQCGFSSHVEGNHLADSEQWDKLGQIVGLAGEIWADA
jgi:5-methyltetrahydropteroyltriglutamate--homocysteine methyltransferase